MGYGHHIDPVKETAYLAFGASDFLPETHLFLPSQEVRAVVRRFLPLQHRRRHGQTLLVDRQSDTTVRNDDTELLYMDVRATYVDPDILQFHHPVMVRVHAIVRNTSNNSVTEDDMPRLYCIETGEVIHCSMDARILEPGKTSPVVYSVIARDAYLGWLLLQVGKDPTVEPLRFSGLNGLSDLISGAIQQCLDDTKSDREFLAEGLSDANKAEKLVDRVLYVMDGGECFHTDPRCGNSYRDNAVHAKDAYAMGYRPCEKCVGTDWWCVPGVVTPDDTYWLSTCSREAVIQWDYADYDFDC